MPRLRRGGALPQPRRGLLLLRRHPLRIALRGGPGRAVRESLPGGSPTTNMEFRDSRPALGLVLGQPGVGLLRCQPQCPGDAPARGPRHRMDISHGGRHRPLFTQKRESVSDRYTL